MERLLLKWTDWRQSLFVSTANARWRHAKAKLTPCLLFFFFQICFKYDQDKINVQLSSGENFSFPARFPTDGISFLSLEGIQLKCLTLEWGIPQRRSRRLAHVSIFRICEIRPEWMKEKINSCILFCNPLPPICILADLQPYGVLCSVHLLEMNFIHNS